jgi:hypothetical protein
VRRDRRCRRRAGRRRRAQAGTIAGADAADPPRGSAECPGSTDHSEDIFLVPGLVHDELHAAVNLADLEAGGHVPADTAGAAARARDPDRGAPNSEEGPARLPTKPVESIASTGGQILVTSAHGLTKAPSSSESLLLLLVGLALVVLVVGETTFLRLAARGPAPQRAAEEPLPIRQVQLRR